MRRKLIAPATLAGVLLVAAAAAAAMKLLGAHGGSTGLASASSDSVALISARTSRLQASFPVGGNPSSVAVGAGAVWALNADDQTLTRIDPVRRAEHAYGTDGIPVDLAAGDGSVWVVNGARARAASAVSGAPIPYPEPTSVSQLDPTTALTLATITLPQAPAAGPPTSYQIAVGPRGVWVINADGSVSRIDPASNRVVAVIKPPGSFFVNFLFAGGRWLWDVSPAGGVYKIDPATNRIVEQVHVDPPSKCGAPPAPQPCFFGAGYADGTVWAYDQVRQAIIRISD